MTDKLLEILDKELERLHKLLPSVDGDEERDIVFEMIRNLHMAFQTHVVIPASSENTHSYGTISPSGKFNPEELPF